MVVLCSMHDIYCFQLERFLCRECGKIKCSCETPSAAGRHLATSGAESSEKSENGLNDSTLNKSDSVEYRNQRVHVRPRSGSEADPIPKKQFTLAHRASEQPFVRSTQAENGKLRRSFAVRSREGLENLLSFASIRKGPDPAKTKQAQTQ